MQNRYVGDIGDYVKLGILRRLAARRRLGVMWWLYPDEGHNADGRHIGYLQDPQRWRKYDPELFDGLATLVAQGGRRVALLETSGLLPGAKFASEVVPTEGSWRDRGEHRMGWFQRAKAAVSGCDLVFVDPDNGLETSRFTPHAKTAGKSVSTAELLSLRSPGRALLVYHHQTRRAGGHHEELRHWGRQLKAAGFDTVDVLRAPRFSPRAFFLLDADAPLRAKAEQLARDWSGLLEWHPNLCRSSAASAASDGLMENTAENLRELLLALYVSADLNPAIPAEEADRWLNTVLAAGEGRPFAPLGLPFPR